MKLPLKEANPLIFLVSLGRMTTTSAVFTAPFTCSKENSPFLLFGPIYFSLTRAFPRASSSCLVAFSITKSMWSVPTCMVTLLLYSLSLTTTNRQGSSNFLTHDRLRTASTYPLYFTLISPVPSMSRIFFKLFIFNPKSLATILEIVEICDLESTRAFNVVPFRITSVSFASPIRRNKGVRVVIVGLSLFGYYFYEISFPLPC